MRKIIYIMFLCSLSLIIKAQDTSMMSYSIDTLYGWDINYMTDLDDTKGWTPVCDYDYMLSVREDTVKIEVNHKWTADVVGGYLFIIDNEGNFRSMYDLKNIPCLVRKMECY